MPGENPLHTFAAGLRELRAQAGNPTFASMARKAGRSRTAFSEASGGDHLPTWETVAAYVKVCGGDERFWATRWASTRDEVELLRAERAVDDPLSVKETTGSSTPVATPKGVAIVTGATPLKRQQRARKIALVSASALGAIAVVLILWLHTASAPSQAKDHFFTREADLGPGHVVVQNKHAEGVKGLIEDETAAYLSTKTLPLCRLHGCKLPNTELRSGTVVRALCWGRGTLLHNYNLDAPEVRKNLHHIDSDLWYRLVAPNGQSGWLSEIYVAPETRGTNGLPECGGTMAEGLTIE